MAGLVDRAVGAIAKKRSVSQRLSEERKKAAAAKKARTAVKKQGRVGGIARAAKKLRKKK